MLDHYQVQLTRMLEAEQYSEARGLLRFLLQCQGEDKRHYEEWENLLTWLDMAFPDGEGRREPEQVEDEETIRQNALDPGQQDEAYIRQVLYIMKHHPMMDQQMLALERAALLRDPEVDQAIIQWLASTPLHPFLQFRALQCLRKRGLEGKVTVSRSGKLLELDIEATPLTMADFPSVLVQILERVEQATDVFDPTLPHFAREMWRDCLQYLYGTSTYVWMQREEEETIECFAAALHATLLMSVYGAVDEEEVRDTYGITETLRFRYEQACRVLRQVIEAEDTDFNDFES
ncbi:hypothetical protein EBB07_00650 [Paenibacillaceae bacterium]|nr:hypothetical protein EBB07_00650 [Paenibacillaceae bacterium]